MQPKSTQGGAMRRAGFAAAFVVGATLAGGASAQVIQDRYWIQGGGYFPQVDSNATIGIPGDPGTPINLERDLGLSHSDAVGDLQIGAKLFGSKRLRIVGEVLSLSRSGSKDINENITIGDVTYPVGATVNASFRTTLYRGTIGYSFLRNDQFELGAGLGFYGTEFSATASGEGYIGDSSGALQAQHHSFLAPLPTVAVYANYQPVRRLNLGADFNWFDIHINGYSGGITGIDAHAMYEIVHHVRLGVKYQYVDYHFSADQDSWQGNASYKFYGPGVFLNVGF
jgi:hypothetical protein